MELPKPLFPDQEFFNMGDACRVVRLPDYTLRYWESQLRQLRPARRQSGHRRYTKRDLEMILRIKDLVNNQRMTLSGARRVLLRELRRGGPTGSVSIGPENLKGNGGPADPALLKTLRDVRSDLKDLLSELNR